MTPLSSEIVMRSPPFILSSPLSLPPEISAPVSRSTSTPVKSYLNGPNPILYTFSYPSTVLLTVRTFSLKLVKALVSIVNPANGQDVETSEDLTSIAK